MAELVAKYQQYDKYKDSGVERLGNIPECWKILRVKNVLKIRNGRDYKDVEVESGGYPVYGSGGIFKRSSGYLYDGKSILFGRKGTVDKPLLVSGRFWTVDTMFYSEVFDNALLEYIYYQALIFPFDLLTTNTALPSMTQEDLLELNFVLPSMKQQTKITNFLDYETAQIDILIDKQQTLIKLLKEKRQAVISHAVTKGLNPDAPMKDSGVEWLGEVPEHWDVKRIKHYGKIIGGFAFKSDDFIESGYPVLKISNVSHFKLSFDEESFLPPSFVEKHLEYKVEENDLVFAMTRPIISGGIKVAKVPKMDLMPLVNQRVGFLKLKSELLADFILYSSLSSSFKAQFKNNMTITNQPNISGEGIESVAFPMPPENELIEIIEFLKRSETTFQNLSVKSEIQIELLQERRTALISAAVTGKIDVRGWQAPDIDTVL